MKLRTFSPITLLVFVVCWFAVPVTTLHACSTPVPVAWFTESITVDRTVLPPNIEVIIIPPSANRPANVLVQNTSATPLFFLVEGSVDESMNLPTSIALPEYMAPKYKLVDGLSYIWNGQDWITSTEQPFVLYIWQNRINTRQEQLADVGDINPYNQIRPTSIVPPPSSRVNLPIMYGNELKQLPLTITYSLNSTYRDSRVFKDISCGSGVTVTPTNAPAAPRAPANPTTIPLLVGVIGVGIVIASLGVYLGRKSRQ